MKTYNWEGVNPDGYFLDKLEPIPSALPSFQDRKRGSAGMPRPISYAVFCLKKKTTSADCLGHPKEYIAADPMAREGVLVASLACGHVKWECGVQMLR